MIAASVWIEFWLAFGVAPFVVALLTVMVPLSLVRHRFSRAVCVGVILYVAWVIYYGVAAEHCPPESECQPVVGVLIGFIGLVFWAFGAFLAWLISIAIRR